MFLKKAQTKLPTRKEFGSMLYVQMKTEIDS